MSGINKVILIGNLGQDPETKESKSGPVSNISIATSRKWKDKNTGTMMEETEWHRVVFFGRLAEIVDEYLRKGSKVYIEGRLKTSTYEDKTGKTCYSTSIIASEMQMLNVREDKKNSDLNKTHPGNVATKNLHSSVQDDQDIPF